jgi:hypothetical protein
LLGNGDGSFREAIVGPDLAELLEIDDGWTSFTFRVADLNGDERPDLLVSRSRSAARVLIGNGDGSFAPGAVLPALPEGPAGLAIEDFDEDGDLDLAHFEAGEAPVCALQLYRGTATVRSLPYRKSLAMATATSWRSQPGISMTTETPISSPLTRSSVRFGSFSITGMSPSYPVRPCRSPRRRWLCVTSTTMVIWTSQPVPSALGVATESATCCSGRVTEPGVATDFGYTICELPPFGHVNRDAFLDVLARHVGFGRGDGGFDNGRELRFQGASADFDGDALIDLANVTVGRLDIFIGQGDGTFKGCYR